MKITRVSALTGVKRTMDLPITVEQLLEYEKGGLSIREAFPNLNPQQVEFFETGVVGEEREGNLDE